MRVIPVAEEEHRREEQARDDAGDEQGRHGCLHHRGVEDHDDTRRDDRSDHRSRGRDGAGVSGAVALLAHGRNERVGSAAASATAEPEMPDRNTEVMTLT